MNDCQEHIDAIREYAEKAEYVLVDEKKWQRHIAALRYMENQRIVSVARNDLAYTSAYRCTLGALLERAKAKPRTKGQHEKRKTLRGEVEELYRPEQGRRKNGP